MKGVFKVSLLVLLLITGKTSIAQVDPHFSQYYVYPSWMNPALTGVFDGTYRVSAIYRNQWGGIAGFNTPGVSFDMNTNKNISFGGSVMNLKAGDAGYNYLTAYGSASYSGIRFGLNGTQRVIFGMQAGIMNRRFDPSKFTTSANWDPQLGQVSNPGGGEVFSNTSSTMFDMGAGALYIDGKPGKKANFYGGLAVSHLTQPEDEFIKDQDAKVPMRLTLHGGVRINVNENWSITPNFLFLSQAQAKETMIGAYAQVKATPTSDFLFGANYRFKDAISPYIGFYHKDFVLGASYDVNTSDLGKATRGANSFELSLTWIGRKAFRAEEEQFVCPRL